MRAHGSSGCPSAGTIEGVRDRSRGQSAEAGGLPSPSWLVSEIEAKGAPLSGATTVGVLLDRWLEYVTALREPGTIRGYATHVRRIKPVLGKIKVAKLTAQHLDGADRDWLAAGLSPTTVHHVHAVLGAALHQAVRWSVLPKAVTDQASRLGPPPTESDS